MKKDKLKLYIVSAVTFAVLLAVVPFGLKDSKILTACLLLPLTLMTCMLVKKRASLSIHQKEALLLLSGVAVMYVVLIEMTGIYFGYHNNPYTVSPKVLLTCMLPLASIIVTSEIIRTILLMQKNKIAEFFCFLSCLLAEILMFANLANISSVNRFMDLVAMIIFPAISANVFYHYVSKRFGMMPNVVFRLITTLYVYFLKTTTAMPDSLWSCIKIVLPIVLLSFTIALFEKEKKKAKQKGKVLGKIGTALTVIVIIGIAMLISCQFRFGALVIATDSMTGEINKGDMVLYERYDDQQIREGQVIIFQKGNSRIVHRVVRIEHIGGEFRYYTKGDANEAMDSGYRVDGDIVGLTDFKISYVGFPTLWLHEILSF